MDSEALRAGLRDFPVVVSFSGGKDCMAAWIALREANVKVVGALFLQLIPGLTFVDEHIARCEQWFGMPIKKLIHPSTVRMLREGVFQPPERYDLARSFANWNNDHVDKWVQAEWPGALCALGCRVHDSLVRRAAVVRFNAQLNTKRRTTWPIYDWTTGQCVEAIERAGMRLPVDYRMFGRTFDGIHWQYLDPIRKHYPNDYRKIAEWFPLIEAEFTRRERAGREAR